MPGCTPTRCKRVVSDGFINRGESADLVRAAKEAMVGRVRQGDSTRVATDAAQAGYAPLSTTTRATVEAITARVREAIVADFGVGGDGLFDSGGTLTRLRSRGFRGSGGGAGGSGGGTGGGDGGRDINPNFRYWHAHVDLPSDYVVNRLNIASYDYSALLYLNSHGVDFEGGELVFVDEDEDRVVQPLPGRLVTFTAGHENLHRVERVTRGERFVLALWFTCSCSVARRDSILAGGAAGGGGSRSCAPPAASPA